MCNVIITKCMWMRVLVIPPKRNETKRKETVCICIIHAIEPSAVMTGQWDRGTLDLNLALPAGEGLVWGFWGRRPQPGN